MWTVRGTQMYANNFVFRDEEHTLFIVLSIFQMLQRDLRTVVLMSPTDFEMLIHLAQDYEKRDKL